MVELLVGVAQFLFGVEGAGFPGASAECEVADFNLERFVDFFAGGGPCLPAVPAPEELGDEYAWRREEHIEGIRRCGSRIHGVRPLRERTGIERVETDKISESSPTSHHLGSTLILAVFGLAYVYAFHFDHLKWHRKRVG